MASIPTCRAQVGQDVPNEVARHHHIKPRGVAHQLHGRHIRQQVGGLHVGIFGLELLEHALPEASTKTHRVVLVHHAHFFAAAARQVKRVTLDALHPQPRVDLHVLRHFLWRPLFEDAPTPA